LNFNPLFALYLRCDEPLVILKLQ